MAGESELHERDTQKKQDKKVVLYDRHPTDNVEMSMPIQTVNGQTKKIKIKLTEVKAKDISIKP